MRLTRVLAVHGFAPYFAVGPNFAADQTCSRAAEGAQRLLQARTFNIGILQAAFNFGGVPPLDGGGIFQPGLQYGGGIKYRVLPRLTMARMSARIGAGTRK